MNTVSLPKRQPWEFSTLILLVGVFSVHGAREMPVPTPSCGDPGAALAPPDPSPCLPLSPHQWEESLGFAGKLLESMFQFPGQNCDCFAASLVPVHEIDQDVVGSRNPVRGETGPSFPGLALWFSP